MSYRTHVCNWDHNLREVRAASRSLGPTPPPSDDLRTQGVPSSPEPLARRRHSPCWPAGAGSGRAGDRLLQRRPADVAPCRAARECRRLCVDGRHARCVSTAPGVAPCRSICYIHVPYVARRARARRQVWEVWIRGDGSRRRHRFLCWRGTTPASDAGVKWRGWRSCGNVCSLRGCGASAQLHRHGCVSLVRFTRPKMVSPAAAPADPQEQRASSAVAAARACRRASTRPWPSSACRALRFSLSLRGWASASSGSPWRHLEGRHARATDAQCPVHQTDSTSCCV